jgi:hypothetical protein
VLNFPEARQAFGAESVTRQTRAKSLSTGQTETFERVAECLHRYSTTGTCFEATKVRG